MALTPQASGLIIGKNIPVMQPAEQPTHTYAVDFTNKRVRGKVDGLEAMRQAIFMILQTERFDYLIHPWRYGSELHTLLGKNTSEALSRVQNLIEEALLADSRISAVRDFQATQIGKQAIQVTFSAVTAFGETQIEKEVALVAQL